MKSAAFAGFAAHLPARGHTGCLRDPFVMRQNASSTSWATNGTASGSLTSAAAPAPLQIQYQTALTCQAAILCTSYRATLHAKGLKKNLASFAGAVWAVSHAVRLGCLFGGVSFVAVLVFFVRAGFLPLGSLRTLANLGCFFLLPYPLLLPLTLRLKQTLCCSSAIN